MRNALDQAPPAAHNTAGCKRCPRPSRPRVKVTEPTFVPRGACSATVNKGDESMARVQAPLLSLSASGTIGDAITFSTWKGRPYVRTRVIPANPRSGLQVGMRAGIASYPHQWNVAMTSTSRALWNQAVGAEAISGFNLFTRMSQKSLRNNYAPFLAHADMTQAGTPAAPGDAAAVQDGTDVDITWTVVGGSWMLLIFHSLTTPFTPGISNLIACTSGTLQLWVHRNPGIGTHYYDCRSTDPDGGVGALEGEFNAAVA